MKFGLMKYSYTTNLGNEIQSIAARRFLPKIDYYIEHEKLNLFQNQEKVKMIMNGWYLDCLKSWPPSDSIDPLLISMHFTTSANDTKTVISSPESRDFLSTYGPVGCRDYATLELLKEIDIDAYYSGCLTLTLESKKTKTEKDYIVVNSYNSKEIIDFLKSKTDLPIYDINQEFIYSFDKKYLERMPTSYVLTSFLNYNEKFFVAENILNLYKNACCVLTDRVHAAFPCLALETPVLFFNSAKFAPERFKGISDLVLESTIEGYKNNYDIFDVENPPKNSKKYLKIRKDLINRTKSFTGHISDSYEIWHDSEEIRNYQTYLLTNTARESREYMHNVIHMSRDFESKINSKNDIIENYKKIINENEKTIKKQKNLINEMQNSNSWKLTKPIRNFRSIFTKKKGKKETGRKKENFNVIVDEKDSISQESFVEVKIIECTSNKVIYKFETSKDLDKFFLKKEMFIELLENKDFDLTTVPKSILIIPAISNVLPLIWLLDSTLIIDELDEEFFKAIPNIKQGYKDMYKKANFKGNIKCNSLKNNSYKFKNKYLSFFSGGVDSVCMAVKYKDCKPNLITLWGSDFPLNDVDGWKVLKDNVSHFAEEYGLNSFFVKSDFRLLLNVSKLYNLFSNELENNGSWWYAVQHGISIISHGTFLAYLLKVEKILFSSSYQYKKEDILNRENIIPCASSPFIDNEFKFASCSVVHDGWELYRLEKIKTIVDFKNKNNAKVNLHVCWYNTSGENCNLCEKCTRTYMSLIAMGEDPHEYGFNVNEKVFNHSKETFEEAILKKKKIGGWGIHKEILRAWNDNKSLFKQNEEYWRNTPFEWILDVDFDELMENFDD